ncbi:hypothetical protein HZC31_00585 [Candidatus Woesearchaeota archaeon]|nr:hypothetical protein [Candidatus Woesearchaeota archaeon]
MAKQERVTINDEHAADSFYDDSLPTALRAAQARASETGNFVKSMPEILVLRRKAPFTNPVWSTWYTCASEEDVGTTEQGNKVMIEVHGGGILTPERIETAYQRRLTKQYAAHLAESEVKDLLKGKLADQTEIPVYSFADFRKGITDLPRRYAVVMDYEMAKSVASGHFPVESLRDNALVIVRAGGVAEANAFVDKIAQRYTSYGNWHLFNAINADEAQGRVLFAGNNDYYGLVGNYSLNGNGRFLVGVAPEAHVARSADAKKSPLEGMVNVALPRDFLTSLESGAETITYNGRTYDLRK